MCWPQKPPHGGASGQKDRNEQERQEVVVREGKEKGSETETNARNTTTRAGWSLCASLFALFLSFSSALALFLSFRGFMVSSLSLSFPLGAGVLASFSCIWMAWRAQQQGSSGPRWDQLSPFSVLFACASHAFSPRVVILVVSHAKPLLLSICAAWVSWGATLTCRFRTSNFARSGILCSLYFSANVGYF